MLFGWTLLDCPRHCMACYLFMFGWLIPIGFNPVFVYECPTVGSRNHLSSQHKSHLWFSWWSNSFMILYVMGASVDIDSRLTFNRHHRNKLKCHDLHTIIAKLTLQGMWSCIMTGKNKSCFMHQTNKHCSIVLGTCWPNKNWLIVVD